MKAKELKQILSAYIERENIGIAEYETIMEFAKNNEGKPINNRLKFPENFVLDITVGLIYLKNTITSNLHLIGNVNSYGGRSENTLNPKLIYDRDACFGYAAKKRVEAGESILNNVDGKFDAYLKLINRMEKSYKEFESAYKEIDGSKLFGAFYNPIYYDVRKTIVPERISRAM